MRKKKLRGIPPIFKISNKHEIFFYYILFVDIYITM